MSQDGCTGTTALRIRAGENPALYGTVSIEVMQRFAKPFDVNSARGIDSLPFRHEDSSTQNGQKKSEDLLMFTDKWTMLQLFADGTGDGGAASATGENGDAAGHQRLQELGVPASKLRNRSYKLPTKAAAPAVPSESAPQAEAPQSTAATSGFMRTVLISILTPVSFLNTA